MKEIRNNDFQRPLRLGDDLRVAAEQTATHKPKVPPPFSIRCMFEARAKLAKAASIAFDEIPEPSCIT